MPKYIRVTDNPHQNLLIEVRENNKWKFLTDNEDRYADFLYNYIAEEAYREELSPCLAQGTCIIYRLTERSENA